MSNERRMDNEIKTYDTLWNLVDIDSKDHKLKDIANLFLNAMNDWPTFNLSNINDFLKELKEYFGSPLTIERIGKIEVHGQNLWQIEAGSSITELIETSTRFYNQPDFDKIIENLLNYYNEQFITVDFIAELQYLTTKQGGRKTPAISGYRPQVKFDFTEMQTSGQQTFIDKEEAFPGDKIDAKIKLLSPDYFFNGITEGMSFEFREGATIIGTGQVKYIVNDRLEKASR
jgi:hypothetical protein